jgi:hypothetical protein
MTGSRPSRQDPRSLTGAGCGRQEVVSSPGRMTPPVGVAAWRGRVALTGPSIIASRSVPSWVKPSRRATALEAALPAAATSAEVAEPEPLEGEAAQQPAGAGRRPHARRASATSQYPNSPEKSARSMLTGPPPRRASPPGIAGGTGRHRQQDGRRTRCSRPAPAGEVDVGAGVLVPGTATGPASTAGCRGPGRLAVIVADVEVGRRPLGDAGRHRPARGARCSGQRSVLLQVAHHAPRGRDFRARQRTTLPSQPHLARRK